MSIPKKPRKCRVCKADFKPVRCLQTVCSPDCAITQAKFKRAKDERIQSIEDRKTIKLKLDAMKPLSYYADKAQTAVNAYRRAVLSEEPCISCGRHHKGQYHAGNFISRERSNA